MPSFLASLFDPNRNTNRGFQQAQSIANQNAAVTNPFLKDLINSGQEGNSYLRSLMGMGPHSQSTLQALIDSPIYQTQLQEGVDSIDASAASRGMLNSGDTLKAISDYGQRTFGDFRQQEIGNALNQTNLGLQGTNGLNQNTSHLANLAINAGKSRDQGNRGLGENLLGIGGTLLGYGLGRPGAGTGRIG